MITSFDGDGGCDDCLHSFTTIARRRRRRRHDRRARQARRPCTIARSACRRISRARYRHYFLLPFRPAGRRRACFVGAVGRASFYFADRFWPAYFRHDARFPGLWRLSRRRSCLNILLLEISHPPIPYIQRSFATLMMTSLLLTPHARRNMSSQATQASCASTTYDLRARRPKRARCRLPFEHTPSRFRFRGFLARIFARGDTVGPPTQNYAAQRDSRFAA